MMNGSRRARRARIAQLRRDRKKTRVNDRDPQRAFREHDSYHWCGLERLEPRVLMHGDGTAVTDHGHDTQDDTVDVVPNLPHQDNLVKQHEHLAVFDLVKRENATHIAIQNGDWSRTSTWKDIDGDSIGDLPGIGSHVLIQGDTTVVYDLVSEDALHTVRVDGVLSFDHTVDTRLIVDTLVVDVKGTLEIGTLDNPISGDVTAVIVIADGGAIDTDWDPTQISRGLISHGKVEIHGADVTPFVSLEVNPRKRDTELILSDVPNNWKVGDRIVLTGTNQYKDQSEQRTILGIDGNRVTIDPLKYGHIPPADGLSVYVTNLSRNVVVLSENPFENNHRGHVMFMHSDKIEVHNAGFYGVGRTDKRNHIDDPQLDDHGDLIEGTGLNPRGRYAVHFHRTGASVAKTPAVVTGSVVVDSPGWGFVNHDSYVIMEDNVTYDVVGAGFSTEIGNEIGAFRRNLAIKSTGSGDKLESREDIFDFGHQGHGFWFQGGGVHVVDNIAVGHRNAAFIFFTRSSEAEFDSGNLPDPSIANGQKTIKVGQVPIFEFRGNKAFASKTGLGV